MSARSRLDLRRSGPARAPERGAQNGARHADIADDVVGRVLTGTGTEPGRVIGEESRRATIGDVVRLTAIALSQYDGDQGRAIAEYVEYRLSWRGRCAAARRRWATHAGRATVWLMRRHPAIGRMVRAVYERLKQRRCG